MYRFNFTFNLCIKKTQTISNQAKTHNSQNVSSHINIILQGTTQTQYHKGTTRRHLAPSSKMPGGGIQNFKTIRTTGRQNLRIIWY
jgi:hypothetical protein